MKKAVFLIIIICFGLVVIWFRDGYIMGAAEAVLPFYDLGRYLDLSSYAWSFHPGLGNITGLTVASKPTYFVFAIFQQSGMPGFVVQAMMFFWVLVSGGLGSFLLIRELRPNLKSKYYILSAMFYLFNPISLVEVWNRFLPNFIVFYGALPIILWLVVRGIIKRNYFYTVLLPVVMSVYSYAFSSIAFLFLIWIVIGLVTFFYLFNSRSSEIRFFCIKYFGLSLTFFVLGHAWYLTQIINYVQSSDFDSGIRVFHPQNTNLTTLDSLSNKMGNITDLYRLINRSFLTESELPWVNIYKSAPYIIGGFLTTLVALYGLMKNIKERNVLFLGYIFFGAIFLSKGSNPPFGFIYSSLFERLVFLQVFRNPVEKFSFVVLVAFAPLFALGVYSLGKKFKTKWILVFAYALVILWIYPFVTGRVFTSKNPPNDNYDIGYKVAVPTYYRDANSFFENHGSNFRVVGLPVADEGITYLWEKGYQGADIPSTLFSMPVILFDTPAPYYYSLVKDLEGQVANHNQANKVDYFLNVRYLFVRSDIDYKLRDLTDPNRLIDILDARSQKGELKKIDRFGNLTVYEDPKWSDVTFYAANMLVATEEAKLAELGNLLSDQALYEGEREFKSNSTPIISYQKINPTQYKIRIQNARDPFVLVFSETYHSQWQAFVNGAKLNDHFRVNVYANGWMIDKIGDYEIVVKFAPQNWLEKGQGVSVAFLFLSLGFLIMNRKKL